MTDRRIFLKAIAVTAALAFTGRQAKAALEDIGANEMPNILLIAGPGGTAFNKSDVEKMESSFTQAGGNVTVLGNGERPVSSDELSEALKQLSSSNGHTTVFIMAHGDVKRGKHVINIDGNYGLTAPDLFDEVKRSFGERPVDIFMTGCRGGAAIPEIERLPKGSNVVALAPGNEPVVGYDVDRFIQDLQSANLDASGLLDHYLGKSLENRIAPVLATSGVGVYDLPRAFIAHVGKPFSLEEREAAHRRLDPVIGQQEVDRIVDKIAGAKTEWEIPALDFGRALAVTHVASPNAQPVSTYNPNLGSHSCSELDRSSGFETRTPRMPPIIVKDLLRFGKRLLIE